MNYMEKLLRSEYVARFSDCDPFGHLNNARYIDYFLDAREDHLKKFYDMDLQSFYKQGLSWFVAGHEIVYLRPAQYNEKIIIQSCLFHTSNDSLWVEFQMMDENETHIKSIMWTRFVPVNVKTGKKEIHPQSFMEFANQVVVSDIDVKGGLKERLNFLVSEKSVARNAS
jgi:YbgC/YbaW family acyl-CoA thioester hydrolase